MYAMNSKNQVSDRVIIRAWWGRQAKASLKSGRYHKTEEQKGVSLVNNLGGGGSSPGWGSSGPKASRWERLRWAGGAERRPVWLEGNELLEWLFLVPFLRSFWVPGGLMVPQVLGQQATRAPVWGELGRATKKWQRLRGDWWFRAVRCYGERVAREVKSFLSFMRTSSVIPSCDWLVRTWLGLATAVFEQNWPLRGHQSS